jgi:hypothetical protein
MRKLTVLILSVVLAAGVSTSGYAQQMSAGVKGGLSISNLGGDLEDWFGLKAASRTTLTFGAAAGIDLHEYFRLAGELYYTPGGASLECRAVDDCYIDGFMLFVGDIAYKGTYLQLLVPATLMIPIEESVFRPRVYMGPRLGLQLSCKIKFDGTLEGEPVSEDFDCDDPDLVDAGIGGKTKTINFGWLFGAGTDIMVGSGAITADILYNFGLTDVNDEPSGPEIKPGGWGFLVGYVFYFGG